MISDAASAAGVAIGLALFVVILHLTGQRESMPGSYHPLRQSLSLHFPRWPTKQPAEGEADALHREMVEFFRNHFGGKN